MVAVKEWIRAFRLRTLPLAASCVLMGSAVAYTVAEFRASVFVLALLTTILLQILSNLANDYGDGIKGTDNEDRLGPQRSIQRNAISLQAMRNAIVIFSALSFGVGLWLIYLALQDASVWTVLFFVGLGVAAIVAAIMYTVGKRAYGYVGGGDFFVLLFFGLVGVGGVYYLHALRWDTILLLPAFFVGLMSVAVLNLNNMRDIENDKKSGKITLAVRLGSKRAKFYHTLLIIVGWGAYVMYLFYTATAWYHFLPLLVFSVMIKHLVAVWKTKSPQAFDPALKQVALSTFLTTLLYTVVVLF